MSLDSNAFVEAYREFDKYEYDEDILDSWCKKQTGTRTVYPNYESYVRVEMSWFE